MIYLFEFPPEKLSDTHAFHTGITEFTPTIEVGDNYNSYYGTAPNKTRIPQEIAALSPFDRAEWIKKQTGIQYVKL